MTRFSRIRRRPDHWATPHDRARARAAERLDGPLGLAEAAWLDEHLEGCRACAEIAESYDADRLVLRTLRDNHPEPPRDLWARTAAAIEQESVARGLPARSTKTARGRRVPLGAISGIAVIAVVVSVSVASNGLWPGAGAGASPSSQPAVAGSQALPTPMAISAGDVQYLRSDNGVFAYRNTHVNEVCPSDGEACPTLPDDAGRSVALTDKPHAVIRSPSNRGQAIVEVDDGAGGQQLVVVTLPEESNDPDRFVSPSPAPDLSPDASAVASASPDGGSPSPVPSPSAMRSGSPIPTGESSGPAPSGAPGSAAPSSDPAASAQPLASASSEPSSSEEPTASAEPVGGGDTSGQDPSPEPTTAASLAIANGVDVVSESAAFSADGAWFAFTARPAAKSAGPDIYVWRVGDAEARRLTTDGRTVFASWDGNQIVGSRANAEDPSAAVSVRIDPRHGKESAAGDAWRPMVDPAGHRAVAWSGTVKPKADGSALVPDRGRLELIPWAASLARMSDRGVVADGIVVADGPLTDFDVRWDETGEWFALWIADPETTEIGRLSLFHVDATTGGLAELEGAPVEVPALPGFSIGEGRLAWATPPGQDGEGSRVQVVAWEGDSVGSTESVPGEEIVVVR